MRGWNLYRPNRGNRGAPGTGVPGPEGPQGPAGRDGVDGAPGRDGIDGAPGRDGIDGLPGRDGVDGLPGTPGTPGAPGRDGIDGTNGTNGAPGAAATISVNSTTTLPSGSPATVTNVGTSSAASLNFGIPQGPQGIQGPPGPSKRILTMTDTTNASGNVSFVFSPPFASLPHIDAMLITSNTRQFVRVTASGINGCTVNAFQQNQTLLSLLGIDILTAGTTALSGVTIRIVATET